MSAIGVARADIAALVEEATSVRGFAYLPERLVPPCAVVMPGATYIESGDTFGSFTARYTVDLVMGNAANSVSSSGLDDQLENAIIALVNEGYSIEQVSQPYAMEVNNAAYLSATIQVTTKIRP
jgi:hypothetical protein